MSAPIDRPLRVTFLTVMPSPYMRDLFEAMAADPRFQLRVKYLEREAVAAPGVYWKERELPSFAVVLPGRWYRILGARIHFNFGAVRALARDRADVYVVAGYASFTVQVVSWWLGATRRRWLFWGEVPGLERRGPLGSWLRFLAQIPAMRLSTGIAGIGHRAAEAYRGLARRGVSVTNIPYVCDVQNFADQRKRETGPVLRFLYCGQLIHRKGVDLLVQAFVTLAAECHQIRLTLVGAGPLQADLESAVPSQVLDRVRFAGFHEVEALPEFFADADVFVLPSRHDGWGLVVNQAIAAGLAVVVSSAVGAGVDLVREGVNGHIFATGDAGALTEILRSFAGDPAKAVAMGRESAAIAPNLTPAMAVDRWYEACRAVARSRSTDWEGAA